MPTREHLKGRIAEKKRQKKTTGKVSTFLNPGQFGVGDVHIEEPNYSSSNGKPIKFKSIEELCIAELLSEEFEKANSKGHDVVVELKADRLETKIAEKEREKKSTGKVSTFLGNDVSGI